MFDKWRLQKALKEIEESLKTTNQLLSESGNYVKKVSFSKRKVYLLFTGRVKRGEYNEELTKKAIEQAINNIEKQVICFKYFKKAMREEADRLFKIETKNDAKLFAKSNSAMFSQSVDFGLQELINVLERQHEYLKDYQIKNDPYDAKKFIKLFDDEMAIYKQIELNKKRLLAETVEQITRLVREKTPKLDLTAGIITGILLNIIEIIVLDFLAQGSPELQQLSKSQLLGGFFAALNASSILLPLAKNMKNDLLFMKSQSEKITKELSSVN